mmetsp:Transcript_34620/g.78109  ORF Transcript_34620/g.78109 Transcript_34620/m.78109 type:complete len:87 (+) Transcript_34620:300-560(+)
MKDDAIKMILIAESSLGWTWMIMAGFIIVVVNQEHLGTVDASRLLEEAFQILCTEKKCSSTSDSEIHNSTSHRHRLSYQLCLSGTP